MYNCGCYIEMYASRKKEGKRLERFPEDLPYSSRALEDKLEIKQQFLPRKWISAEDLEDKEMLVEKVAKRMGELFISEIEKFKTSPTTKEDEMKLLIKELLFLVNHINSSRDNMTTIANKFYKVKRKILDISPRCQVADSFHFYMFRMLTLLDKIDARKIPDLRINQIVCT